MGAIRLIKCFFEAVGEIFNPSPRNLLDDSSESCESPGPSDKFQNQPDWFWKELLGQRIEESEQVKEMMIEDYESRHEEVETPEMPDEGQYTPDGLRTDAEGFENDSLDASMDSDSGSSESSGYDGYIG